MQLQIVVKLTQIMHMSPQWARCIGLDPIPQHVLQKMAIESLMTGN